MLFMYRKKYLAENAYQNETNMKWCNWDNIFLCLCYSQIYKGEYSIDIYFIYEDVMLKST